MTYLHKLAKRLARTRDLFVAAPLLVVLACRPAEEREFLSPNPGNPNSSHVASLAVSPRAASLEPGQTLQFTATALGQNGKPVAAEVEWLASGGSIDANGHFTARERGRITVQARLRALPLVADSALVAVFSDPSDILAVQLFPDTVSLYEGEGTQIQAVAELADGRKVNSPTLDWSASAGQVDGAGWFQPDGPGHYVILAAVRGGPRGYSRVFVRPGRVTLSRIRVDPPSAMVAGGRTQRFQAMGLYSNGTESPAEVIWSATGGAITPQGEYTAGSTPGTYHVVARHTSGSLSDTAVVQVTEPAVVGLSVSPRTASLAVGAVQQFTAFALLSDGTQRSAGVTWRVTGGSISLTGLYTAPTQAGSYRVVAEIPGTPHADTAVVTVAIPVVTVTQLIVNPASVSLPVGGTRLFQVTASYSNGTTGTPAVNWSASGGTITSGGLYTAGSVPGSYRVVAVEPSSGRADTSDVTITAPVAVRLVLEPELWTLGPGGSRQFTASVEYSDGTWGRPPVSWEATGGSITGDGLYTAGQLAGTFRVIAGVNGVADTSYVTIAPPAPVLVGLAISPTSAAIQSGGSRQFQATATWSDGQSRMPELYWSATGGTITTSGLYLAGSVEGSYRVIVSAPGTGLADTATVTVTAVPVLVGIEVSPAQVNLNPGERRTFSAVGRYSNGSTATVNVTWQATGGTITSLGRYTAGQIAGTFQVIASCSCGFSDTAAVVIGGNVPVAPALQAIELSPSAVTLPPGATQQFQTVGRLSDGSTISVTVSYTATGGTMNGSVYTAGSTAGTYAVIAREGATGLADTAVVTITGATAPPAPVLPAGSPAPVAQVGATSVALSWISVSGADRYRWSGGPNSGGSGSWGPTQTAGPQHTIPRPAAGSHWVCVAAGNVSGWSGNRCNSYDVASQSGPTPTLQAVELTPATVTLAPGGTQVFTVVGRMSDGSTTAVSVTWTAQGGTMSGNTYTAGATAGTYPVIARLASGTLADTASVTITTAPPPPPPPPAGQDPVPSGTILLDTRKNGPHSIQAANSLQEAENILRGAGGVRYTETGFEFTTNLDGTGTRAFRAHWTDWGGVPQDQGRKLVVYLAPSPRPREIYIQWKHWMGRTPTGGGIGEVGAFDITNELDPGGNAGRKYGLLLRDVSDGGSQGRVDIVWPGPSPVGIRLEGWYYQTPNPGNLGLNRASFSPEAQVGRIVTFTLYFRAESTGGARDGAVRMWYNGTLVMEHVGIATGPWGVDRFHMSDTFRSPIMNQTEYFWDLVVWTP
jgi:hypothetical protein